MSYTRPDAADVDFALVGYTPASAGGIAARFPSGSYTAPGGGSVAAQFVDAYTRPAASAVDFSFEPESTAVEGVGAAVLGELTAAGVGAHGVAGTGAAQLGELTAEGIGETDDPEIVGVGDAVLGELTAEGQGAHGVAGAGAATIDGLAADGSAAHGVAGQGAATLGEISAAGSGAHGVAGAGAATIGPITAAGVAVHPVYMLKGEVRDAGILVERRVRAYRRDTGALVGEVDTTLGRFTILAGFTAREHYVVPIHLDEDAVDWLPPVANRVLSVLAED